MHPSCGPVHPASLTTTQSQARGASSPHQIPHLQRRILAHAQRHPPSGMYVDMVDPPRMPLERLEQRPIRRPEERQRGVDRRGEEVRWRGEVQRRD